MTPPPIEKFLEDPRFDLLLGRAAVTKLELLAFYLDGRGSVAEIARKRGIARQVCYRHFARVKAIYGPTAKR